MRFITMAGMKWQILTIMSIWSIDKSESTIGDSCQYNTDCARSSFSLIDKEICVDRVCRCNPEIELKYSSSLTPRCDDLSHSLDLAYMRCKTEGCKENEECVEVTTSVFGRTKKAFCRCKEGHLRVNSHCKEASHQDVLQRCYVPEKGPVQSCDMDENSICRNGKCVCFRPFFANTTSGKCEPKSAYISAYNLTAYRVKPLEYCSLESDCISGLVCRDFQCNCPEPCSYNSTSEICDCGTFVLSELPAGPIVVGLLLGLVILAFWIFMIRRMIKKYALKKKALEVEVTAMEETHDPSSLFPLVSRKASGSPIPEEVTAPADVPEKQSFLPKEENTFSEPAPPPPQASLYGLSNPTLPSSSPGAPPLSSPLPFTAEPPPSYSLNPTEGNFNVPATSVPYPLNPPVAYPPSVSPSNVTESDGATAPSVNPFTAPPYPSNPSVAYPPAVSPSNIKESDGATPPAFNPSFPIPYPSNPSVANPPAVSPSNLTESKGDAPSVLDPSNNPSAPSAPLGFYDISAPKN